jgi:hypothetical protein
LNPEEEKQFASFLKKTPESKKELTEFRKTILEPEKITFEFKAQLKRKERKPVFVYIFSEQRTYYAAAAVLLLVGLFLFFGNNDNKSIYFADNNNSSNSKVINAKSPQGENIVSEKEQVSTAQEVVQEKKQETISANQISIVMPTEIKEEKNSIQTIPSEDNPSEILIAKSAEEKELELEPVQNAIASKDTDLQKDSAITTVASVQGETVALITSAPKKEEYQTVASLVNKKVRYMLGIKKTTECETSDKISLWDFAMVAKQGVQKIIGVKTLDVKKTCEGSGEKVEYFFTAGNFEISKSALK